MAEKKKDGANKKPDQGLAIVALILNILVLPGLGSIICGKTKEGVWQLVLVLGGVFLGILFTVTIIGAVIGIPLMIFGPLAGWVWALVTGIQLVQESSK